MIRRWLTALAALPAIFTGAAPAAAQSILDQCTAETCRARLTGAQLVDEAQRLVMAGRYAEAQPMLAAMAGVPAFRLQYRFLTGYVAAQSGDLPTAERLFRQILIDDPGQTRVRLELGRVLLAQGHRARADRQLAEAQGDRELPTEIAANIRTVRSAIRSRRTWTLSLDAGIAPDSNINNATNADTVTVLFAGMPIPLTLDQRARQRSGLGFTGALAGGVRLPVAPRLALIGDANAFATLYRHHDYDDVATEAAAGLERTLSEKIRVRAQGVVAQRWFGGQVATRQWGGKAALEWAIDDRRRLGVQLDSRHTDTRFDHNYDGRQTIASVGYEQAVSRSVVASATAFVRRDALRVEPYSSTELGGTIGVGGDLHHGITFGVSGGASRARYDAAIPFFSPEPRHDWRLNARASIGYSRVRVLGFSPAVSVTYGRTDSSLTYYRMDRLRYRFALARYF